MGLNVKLTQIFAGGKSAAEEGGPEAANTNAPAKKKLGVNLVNEFLRHVGDKQEALVGVDITPHYLRICEMEESKHRWGISHLGSACMEGKSELEDIRENADLYAETLKQLVKENKIHAKNAAVSVPMSSAVIKTITIPNMTDAEIEQAIAMGSFWENLVQLPSSISDYSIFYEIVKRSPETEEMDLLFVAARVEDVKLYTDIVKKAGLNPTVVDVRCFALNNAFHINTDHVDDDAPVMFLKFGPDENYVLITHQGEPFLYDLFVSDEDRQNIRQHLADPEIVQRYANQAKQIIASHETTHQTQKVKHIYVVSILYDIEPFIEKLNNELTEYEVSECNFFDHLDIPKKLEDKVNSEENRSAWSVAMGLAVRKLDIFGYYEKIQGEDHVNLLPGSEPYKKVERVNLYSKLGLAASVILGVILAGPSYFKVYSETSRLNGELAALSNVENDYNQKVGKVKKLNAAYNTLQSLDKVMEELPSNQGKVLSAYRHLNKVIPSGVWLEEINFNSPNYLEIVGNSIADQQVFDFIKTLKEGSQFSTVTLKTLHGKQTRDGEPTNIKAFTLRCVLSQQSDFANIFLG